MVQILEKLSNIEKPIKIVNTTDLKEIKKALEDILYVPHDIIKSNIISELLCYLEEKFSDENYKLQIYIGYRGTEVEGFVIAQVDPYYTSYSRKCGTFGWLHANNLEICQGLIKRCEKFVKENKLHKIRGNINFPKNLGGIGIQFMGFDIQMLYGVSYNDPNTRILEYLKSLGYHYDSEYSCVRVTKKIWDKGKKIDKNIEFRYLTIKELYDFAEDIRNLATNSFHEILPDASGGNRIYEFFEAFKRIPKSFYKKASNINPLPYTEISQFVEAWETCNFEKIEPFAPMAFDKKTGELVGILLGLPDLFEAWSGKLITRCNVDTAMIKKGYFGRGIFSALNNLGQLTANLFGVTYFEGTAIWSNNSRAINTIFPHCAPIRKHYVMQKRI